MNRRRKIFINIGLFIISFVFLITSVVAHGEETFAAAEEIVKQKISCDDLTQDQLEILGDYYMEQMHPGELHEIMDQRLGGEGSESLKQAHINMGLSFYCGEHGMMSTSMMNVMMDRGLSDYSYQSYGMMNGRYPMSGGWGLFSGTLMLLIIIFLILLIILLIKKIQSPQRRR